MTKTGTGLSTHADTRKATKAAFDAARRRINETPIWVLVFAGPDHDLAVIFDELKRLAPAAIVTGCHTAGEFTELGLQHGGVALMALSSDEMVVSGVTAEGARTNPTAMARAMASSWSTLQSKASAKGLGASVSVLLVDGLAGSGDRVVREYQAATRSLHQIVGGAAGDEGRFKTTGVGGSNGVTHDGATSAQFFVRQSWGAGAGHGLAPASKRMTVTRATGSTLNEIDGKPAYEAWVEHAKTKGVTLTDENRGRFLIGNEIGVYFLDSLHHARAPVGVEPDGSLRLVADITEGASICILDGEPDAMVAACGHAAEQAKKNLGGKAAAGVLVFDCVCRGMILGRGFDREIEAVRAVFPNVPIIGFLTYGEIARFGGRIDGWHNTTSVVAAIPA